MVFFYSIYKFCKNCSWVKISVLPFNVYSLASCNALMVIWILGKNSCKFSVVRNAIKLLNECGQSTVWRSVAQCKDVLEYRNARIVWPSNSYGVHYHMHWCIAVCCTKFRLLFPFNRHLQRFWGASGDYWQRNWEYIYDLFDGDEMSLAMYSEYNLTGSLFCVWQFLHFLLICFSAEFFFNVKWAYG